MIECGEEVVFVSHGPSPHLTMNKVITVTKRWYMYMLANSSSPFNSPDNEVTHCGEDKVAGELNISFFVVVINRI